MANKIIIHTEQELERVAKEAFYILRHLREATVRFQNDHEAYSKQVKQNWEKRADDFLKNPLGERKNLHDNPGIEIDKE